jgi:hypothetical protein
VHEGGRGGAGAVECRERALLWAQRCRARGVEVNRVVLGAAGLVLAPLLLFATVPLV